MRRIWGWFCVSVTLAGCSTTHVAPVKELTRAMQSQGNASAAAATSGEHRATHLVQKGDTLYSIALQYGLDYRELAAWNHLGDLNHIRIGQSLYVTAPTADVSNPANVNAESSEIATPQALAAPSAIVTTKVSLPADNVIMQPLAVKLPWSKAALTQIAKLDSGPQPVSAPPAGNSSNVATNVLPGNNNNPKTANDSGLDWMWPVTGPLLAKFGNADADKGIDIGGRRGQPVYAAAAGKIVYSGTGLHGYGKLVIIKHNAIYLTAYAHNDQLLVKEGQAVVRGQKIAEMGDSDAGRVELHFEIRQMGKPVDPLIFLPEEKK